MRYKIVPHVVKDDYKVDNCYVDRIDNDTRYFIESVIRFGFCDSVTVYGVRDNVEEEEE